MGPLVATGMFLAGCSSNPGEPTKIFRMGEQAPAGSLIYTVYETEWKPQLGEGPGAKIPANRFLILRLSVTNSSNQNSGIPQMTLVDNAGKSYQELTEAPGVPKLLGIIRSVKPAQTEEGRVVFDAPPGAYKLRVTDDSGPGRERALLIEVPFEFEPVPQTEPTTR